MKSRINLLLLKSDNYLPYIRVKTQTSVNIAVQLVDFCLLKTSLVLTVEIEVKSWNFLFCFTNSQEYFSKILLISAYGPKPKYSFEVDENFR